MLDFVWKYAHNFKRETKTNIIIKTGYTVNNARCAKMVHAKQKSKGKRKKKRKTRKTLRQRRNNDFVLLLYVISVYVRVASVW